MIFALFIFFTLIIVGLVAGGLVFKHPGLILIGALFMILAGAGLSSEGIRDDAKYTMAYGDNEMVVTDFNSLTSANDLTVAMIAPSYFYGGFIVLVLSVFGVLWALQQRRGA